MNHRSSVVTAALVVFVVSCARAPRPRDTHDADVQAIRDDQIQWVKDFDSRALDKIVSHFSEDAIVIDKGAPPVNGREGAKKLYKEAAADPASSLKFAPSRIEVAKSGEIGYVWGSYTAVTTVGNTRKTAEDRGTYVSIYKKQPNGSWKDVLDIGASETPLTAAAKE
jgi:ketosteroid isomerase-like protein